MPEQQTSLTPAEQRALEQLLRARTMLTRQGRERLARLLAKAAGSGS